MDHDDGSVRQLYAGIVRRDGVVVPLVDLAQEDAGYGARTELELCLYARYVVGWYHRAQHRGDVEDLELRLRQLLVGHGTVTGAEVHRARRHLPNPAATADRLIVDLNVAVDFVVLIKPLRINGIRER